MQSIQRSSFLRAIIIGSILLGVFGFLGGCGRSNPELKKIYPTVRPTKFIQNVGPGRFVTRDIGENLVLVLKLDITGQIEVPPEKEGVPITGATQYLRPEDLQRFNLKAEAAMKLAMDNFDKEQFPLDAYPRPNNADQTWAIVSKETRHQFFGEDSVLAHLVSEPSLAILHEHLGARFYVYIPTYESFIAMRSDLTDEEMTLLKQDAQQMMKDSLHPF